MPSVHSALARCHLRALSATVALASLAACGGGGDSPAPARAPAPVEAVVTPPPTASTTVSGAVVKGPVNGAQMCAYTVTGTTRGSAQGSCTTTDASGSYSFAVPDGTGPLWVEATGGTRSLPAGSPLVSLLTANGAAGSTTVTLNGSLEYTTNIDPAARAACG